MSSTVARDAPDAQYEVGSRNGFLDDFELDFVKREPLSGMLKVVREPPPMLRVSQAVKRAIGGLETAHGVASADAKLTHTGMVLDLARIVINHEAEIEASADPTVQQGLMEVYRFLQESEHLNLLQQS